MSQASSSSTAIATGGNIGTDSGGYTGLLIGFAVVAVVVLAAWFLFRRKM
jgi:LPXTG-motif cell wall-anchored protein